jgi:hypothetical protein
MDTFLLAEGKIPEVFLRGCGLSDADIEYAKLFSPELEQEEISKILRKINALRAAQALQTSPLFISYSHVDGAFVDKIEKKLNEKGIRFWREAHEIKAGGREKQIERAIAQTPKLLLILSEHSIRSDWVDHEVREARKLEKELGCAVLCPIALDDSLKSNRLPERIREQIGEYDILDFSGWRIDGRFESMFHQLIDALELFKRG